MLPTLSLPTSLLGASLIAASLLPSTLTAQTPEQKYTDWARLDFRAQEYEFRRDRMTDAVRAAGGGIMLVPSADGLPHGGTFRQLDDFWYLTGLELPASMLVLDSDRGGGQAVLFMPPRDARLENPGRRNDFPGRPLLDDYELRGIAGMEAYRDIAELEAYIRERMADGAWLHVNAGRMGDVPHPEVPLFGSLDPTESMIHRLRADYPEADFVNAFEPVARLRMIKSPAEIRHMQIAANATMAGIRAGADRVRAGVDERTIQGAFEEACREFGAQAIPFTPIVKSGPNSLWPWRVLAAHYDRRNRPMEGDELVILDVGCEVDGYISDVGRTFPVGGSFTPLQREKLLVSTNAADAIIAAIRPGITLRELTAIAYDAIPDDEEQYMQTPSFFGHHIGLSSGDPALMDEPLAPGMVFTVEPWYYNHDLEVAVFVEDVILVTEDGAEVLTRALPRTTEELEAMIR
jgi:Xaa-Pro aminopeptidase